VSELMELQGKASSRMPVVVGVFVALCVAGAVVMKSMRGVKTGVNDVTEADTISLAAKPCAGPGQNCEESKCCENKDHKCFVKNQWWASCTATCDTNEIDPYDNLKWNCLELNATVARMQCAKDHEDCRLNGGKCCNKDWTCYVKDEHWSNCNADCKQGEGANSYDKGSWSCEIHEFVCDALTNESLADSLDTAQKLSTCCQDQLCNGAPCTGDKADKCTFYEKKLAQASVTTAAATTGAAAVTTAAGTTGAAAAAGCPTKRNLAARDQAGTCDDGRCKTSHKCCPANNRCIPKSSSCSDPPPATCKDTCKSPFQCCEAQQNQCLKSPIENKPDLCTCITPA